MDNFEKYMKEEKHYPHVTNLCEWFAVLKATDAFTEGL